MTYQILVEPAALNDVQQAIDFYDEQQIGLGKKFESELNKYFSLLEQHPYYQLRYENVRCLPIQTYPYMIHYTINEVRKSIIIRAVLHTSQDPDKWKAR